MRLSLMLLVMFVGLVATATADVPTTLNYQGNLTDNSGVPVVDSSYGVTFTIYDASVSGNSKWSETRTLSTSGGLFSILLGSVTPIEDTVFNGTSRYLGIQVGVDPELSPRVMLVTVPYSFRTATVDGASGGNITSDITLGTESYSLGTGPFTNLFMGGTIGFAQDIGPLFNHPMLVMYPTETMSNPDRMVFETSSNSGVGLLYKPSVARFDFQVGSGLPALSVDLNNFRVGINNISPSVALDVNGVIKAGGGIIGSGSSISGIGSFIAANNSTITGNWASCIGGQFNVVNSDYAWIPGGRNCDATGIYSLAAGVRAKALHDGSFVWADSTEDLFTTDFVSTAVNQFSVRCRGGARFVTAIDGSSNPIAGVELAAGGGSWSSISDSTLKENIRSVDGEEILDKLSQLDISRWNYETQDASIEHIGPMAQDFYRLFGLGEDDTHINTLDPDGVSLAAIKALIEKNEKLESEVAELKKLVDQVLKQIKK